MSSSPAGFEIRIEPKHPLRIAPWRELYEYRDLLWILVWRDIASRYKQTVLGPIWFAAQPVLTTLVFDVIFTRVAHVGTGGTPPTLFYFCGQVFWGYFSATFTSTSTTLSNNVHLFGKVYFPRLLVPLSATVSNLLMCAVQGMVFAGFYIAFKFTPDASLFGAGPSLVFLPLVLAQLAALGLGVGLWVAALTARYRDFTVLTGFLIQLWMYATPVIYPLAKFPPRWRLLVALNPMTMPVEWGRHMALGSGITDPVLTLVSAVVTLAFLISGLLVFSRIEKTFVDVI